MRAGQFLIGLTLFLAWNGQAEAQFEGDSYVTTLTPDNFNSIVGGDKHVLVEFYAPWCIHCKRLTPVYELVGHAFHRSKDVIIAKLDAIAYPAIKEHFEVDGFPTLKFFPGGQKVLNPTDFKGSRSAPELVDFVNLHAGTKAFLKGPAASAGKVPTLTPEAKERAKKRWMEMSMQGPGMGGASPAKTETSFKPPPVVAKKEKKIDDRLSGIPTSHGEMDSTQKDALEKRRRELAAKIEKENQKLRGEKKHKSKKKDEL